LSESNATPVCLLTLALIALSAILERTPGLGGTSKAAEGRPSRAKNKGGSASLISTCARADGFAMVAGPGKLKSARLVKPPPRKSLRVSPTIENDRFFI
jgi:hypothetical protein